MKNYYLVDVSSIFFRSFYAIRQLNNSKGMPTNAIYGFLMAIAKVLKEHKPDGIAFCLDRPEASFREEVYEDYKANRDEAPDELQEQFPYIKPMAEALNIPCFDKEGYEADDIIGTMTQKLKGPGILVTIVSGDKDFGQLVEPGVRLFDPAKDVYVDSDGVRAKMGVDPDQVIDYLALVGDASDNVPGVRGVGPKGAQKLLGQFKTLEGIYKNLKLIPNEKLRVKLSDAKEDAFLSKELVTIVKDVSLGKKKIDIEIKPVRRDLLDPMLAEFEFKTLAKRFFGEESASTSNKPAASSQDIVSAAALPKLKEVEISDPKELDDLLKKDTALWVDASPVGVCFYSDKTLYPFKGDVEKLKKHLNKHSQKKPLKISGFDTKDLAHWLDLAPGTFEVDTDVSLTTYCLGTGDKIDLKELAVKYLSTDLPEFPTAGQRLSLIVALESMLQNFFSKDKRHDILKWVELPLVPILYQMEKMGVRVDAQALTAYATELGKQAKDLEKKIWKSTGKEFNVGSPKQLGQVLFEHLKLPVIRKTKTGYSTDSDVLQKLKKEHEVAAMIEEWREITKLKSTYVEALPRLVNEKTGRVHTTFHQTVTSTGRLSSTNPNLQNIPIRTSRGQKIRESFVTDEGYELVSVDYSQVELRILAHITGDPGLTKAFTEDLDIHSATASEVFEVPMKEVTPEQRRASKAINFGIVYGMSDFGLAENLGISLKEAGDFIAKYFKKYPGVQRYMHQVVEDGKDNGYVETLYGRRRYYKELKSHNQRVFKMAERAAINMPIQGAASDIIKMAMIQVAHNLKGKEDEVRVLLQVHDELLFAVKKDKADHYKPLLKQWIEGAVKLNVPLKASMDSGDTWRQAH